MPSKRSDSGGTERFIGYLVEVLNALNELGGSGQPSEVAELVQGRIDGAEIDMGVITKSGRSRFDNRVHFARLYLVKSGLVGSSQRGVWVLTETGRNRQLTRDEAYDLIRAVDQKIAEDRADRAEKAKEENSDGGGDGSTEELESHRSQLMTIMRKLPANGFERLCKRLLRESGFEKVNVTGRSGDGGIDGDGVLQINPFVSFRVLFQCKRYAGTVGSSQVRDFRGAMQGRADKGIILTTGVFSGDSRREAVRDGVPPIELVDGEALLDLFEQLELGLTPKTAYEVDEQFFTEFEDDAGQ